MHTVNNLGYCPICGASVFSREKRPNGYDNCRRGHKFLSSLAIKEQPETVTVNRKDLEVLYEHISGLYCIEDQILLDKLWFMLH